MKNRLLLCCIIAITIVLLCFVLCVRREKKSIPLFNDVSFGMTPTQVTRQLGAYFDFCQDTGGTNKTTYLYETKVLNNNAIVTCYFLNDKQLTEVSIKWNQNNQDLYENICACIYDHYSTHKHFFTKESHPYGEKYVRLLTGIDNGVTGFFYTIYRSDEYILISCIDNS